MSSTALLSNKSSLLELVAQDDARGTRCNRRIIVPRYGGPDVMTVVEEPLPEPGSWLSPRRSWAGPVCRARFRRKRAEI
jgi:hypothetical protein